MAKWTKEEYLCTVYASSYATLHHIYTQGAHPKLVNEPTNQIPVSDHIHKEWHKQGTLYMANKYPAIRKWLADNGWEVDPVMWKWVNYDLINKD